jgi:hypothetical protein
VERVAESYALAEVAVADCQTMDLDRWTAGEVPADCEGQAAHGEV